MNDPGSAGVARAEQRHRRDCLENVGAGKQRRRHVEAERHRGHQVELAELRIRDSDIDLEPNELCGNFGETLSASFPARCQPAAGLRGITISWS
jgi:hypothetical protein